MKNISIQSKFLFAVLFIVAFTGNLLAGSSLPDPVQGIPFIWKKVHEIGITNNSILSVPPPPPPYVIGDIEAGDSIIIVYRVTLVNPLVPVTTTEIINQGTISGSNFTTVLTDDPSVVGTMDPTITPANNATCTVPALNATINAVNVVANNNGSADVAAFALCNNGTNTLTFSAFTDNNAPNPDALKVIRTVTTTNVTYSEISGVDPLSSYTATTRNATLVSPAAPGTLVLNYLLFADGNNNNILDGGECVSDAIQYTIKINPIPTVNLVSNQVVCNASSTTTINYSGAVSGTVYNWTNNTTSIGLAASGTGNIPAFTALNATSAPVTATITVIPTYTNAGTTCTGTSTTFTITVNPTPSVNAVANQTVCNGTSTAAVTFSGSPAGTVFNWINNTPSIGLAASSSGNIASFTATNATNAPVTATVTVTPAYTNAGTTCTGTAITFTITVNPTPSVNAITNQTVCNGASSAAVTIGGSVAGTVYNWTNNTPSIGLASSGTGNIASFTATNATSAPVTATITVTPSYTNGGTTCTGAPITFTITVNPTPTVNAVANQTVCNGSSGTAVNFSGLPAGTVFNWTNNTPSIGLAASGTGNIASFTAINSGSTPVVATVTVTPGYTNAGTTCTGSPITFIITVNPTPNSVATPASQTICSGSNITAIVLSGNVTGTVYNWVRDNTIPVTGIAAGGAGNISGPLTNTTNAPLTVTFMVTPSYTNAGVTCSGTPTTATVVVNPVPNSVATPSSQTICSGSAITPIVLSGNVTGTVYNWVRDNNVSVTGIAASGAGNISGSLTNTTNAPITVMFTVTPSYTNAGGTCTGISVTASVVVNPVPNAVATPPSQTICSGSPITQIVLSGNVTGTVYNWIRDNTVSVTGITASGSGNISGTLTNTTTAPITVTFTITPSYTNAGNTCTGTPITATVLVNPTNTITLTSAVGTDNQTVLINTPITNITYGTTFATGATFSGLPAGVTGNWAGNVATISGSPSVGPGTFNYTVTLTGGCGTITISGTINVIVCSITRTSTVGTDNQLLCNNTAITNITYATTGATGATFSGLPTGVTGNWAANVVTISGTPTVAGTFNYTITPMGGGCSGVITATGTITVNPVPTVNAVSNQVLCNTASFAAVTFTGSVPGTVYSWTNNTPSIGLAASGSGNIASFTATNATNAPVISTITVIPSYTNAGLTCTGAAITFTITVNPTPNVVANPPSQSICSGSGISTIVLTGAVTGTTYAWTRNNTATVTGIAASGSGNISGTLTNTTSAPVTVTFTITPTANGCPGPAITATVLVNPTPNAIATPASQGICTNNYITPIVLTGSVAGTAFNWTRNNTATVTGIAAFGSGNISGILVNNTAAPITVTFTITPTANGCTGNAITATVIVNPTPIGTISISPNPGCVGSTVQLSASGGTTYLWSGPQGFASTLQNPTILLTTYQQGGQYSVTITSGTGCSVVKYATLKVNYPPIATATYEQNTACTGSTLKLHGNGAGAYAWSGPAGFTSNLKDPVIVNVTSANSGLYTLTVTSPNGCTATTTINVTINTPPVVSANPTLTQTCEGSTVQLTASGTGSFSWSGPAGWVSINQNPVINNIPLYMSGTFTVTLTANTGCSSTASVTIKVYEQIKALATATPNPVCQGQSLQLHAEGGTKYLWTGPAGFQANEADPRIDNITMAHAGIYYVFISNEGGCSGYAEVKVEVKPTLKGTAGATPNPVQEFSQVQFTSSNGVSHSWTGPLGFTSTLQNPQIKKVTRAMAGIYTVMIFNENGCPTIVKVNLKVNYTNKVTGEEDNLETRSEKISKVYPNPTNDILYFECESKAAISYMIYDLTGKEHVQLTTTSDSYISTSNLASGVYQIRWKTQDSEEWINSRFVKIR